MKEKKYRIRLAEKERKRGDGGDLPNQSWHTETADTFAGAGDEENITFRPGQEPLSLPEIEAAVNGILVKTGTVNLRQFAITAVIAYLL
jgi:hypothetical protein